MLDISLQFCEEILTILSENYQFCLILFEFIGYFWVSGLLILLNPFPLLYVYIGKLLVLNIK